MMQLLMAALLLALTSAALIALATQNLRSRETAMARLLRHAPLDGGTGAQGPQSATAVPHWVARWVIPLARTSAADDPKHGALRIRLAEAGFRGRAAVPIYMGGRIALAL